MKKTTVDIDIQDDNPILLELHDKGIKPYTEIDGEMYVHLSIVLAIQKQQTTGEIGEAEDKMASEDEDDDYDSAPFPGAR
jgi:hypothetical protein